MTAVTALADLMTVLIPALMAFLIIVTLAVLLTDTRVTKACHFIDNCTS